MLSRVRFGDGVVGVVADGRTGPEIDDLVSFLASLTSPQYRELGANELARQREIARTTRPQPRHGASLWAETAPARATRPALGRSAHTASACRTGRAGMTTARSSPAAPGQSDVENQAREQVLGRAVEEFLGRLSPNDTKHYKILHVLCLPRLTVGPFGCRHYSFLGE
jgi:hypothetical protein